MHYRFKNSSRDFYASWDNHKVIFPTEYHRQVEVCHVRSGSLTLTLDKTAYTLQEGDMYVIFPYVRHAVEVHGGSKRLWMFSPDLIPELTEILTSRKPICPVIRADALAPLLLKIFNRCVELWLKRDDSLRPLMVAHTTALMHELLCVQELAEWGVDRGMIQRLTGYLMENYKTDITLDSAAAALGYSKFYISHAISEMFGCNFRTLVNNYRISAAQEALLQSNKSIWQIAYDCGFQNQSTFNRTFAKLTGTIPSEYRKSKAKD